MAQLVRSAIERAETGDSVPVYQAAQMALRSRGPVETARLVAMTVWIASAFARRLDRELVTQVLRELEDAGADGRQS